MTVALNDILLAAENLVTQIQTFQSEQVVASQPTLASDLAEVDTLEQRIVAEAQAAQSASDAAAAAAATAAAAAATPAPVVTTSTAVVTTPVEAGTAITPEVESTTEDANEAPGEVDTLEARIAAQTVANTTATTTPIVDPTNPGNAPVVVPASPTN